MSRAIRLAESNRDIDACFPVMVELRPLLERDAFVARVREHGMVTLQLDSGVQRLDAHRFYEREGMKRTAFHCSVEV